MKIIPKETKEQKINNQSDSLYKEIDILKFTKKQKDLVRRILISVDKDFENQLQDFENRLQDYMNHMQNLLDKAKKEK